MNLTGFRWLSVVVVVYLAWLIITQGIATQYANTNAPDDALQAIYWDDMHAKALFNAGKSQTNNDINLLKESLRNNPADSRAVLELSRRLSNTQTNSENIKQLVNIAAELRPSDGDVQAQVAAYLAEQGDMEQALRVWNRALTLTRDYDDRLFPFFYNLLKQTPSSSSIVSFVKDANDWWIRFYYFLAKQDNSLPLLEAVFDLRATQHVDKIERKILINNLQQARQWDKAYIYWLNGLSERQRQKIALLYDGGFEQEISNYGFGWHALGDVALMKTEYGIGVSGQTAMHIMFKGSDRPFYHLYQRIRLVPGKYRLKGRSRSVSLRTLKGLRWRASCVAPENAVLARSGVFSNGNTPWESFEMVFEVPPGCSIQEVRLVAEGRNEIEHRVRGELWLDALEIKHI